MTRTKSKNESAWMSGRHVTVYAWTLNEKIYSNNEFYEGDLTMIESWKKKRIALIEFKKTVAIVILFCLVVPAHAGVLSEALVETKQGTLNIRSGPGTEYPVIEKIPRGQSLHIIQSSSPWYEVQLDDGRQGYAFHQYLRLLDGYRLKKHQAGFMTVGMHVDEVYARLPAVRRPAASRI